METGFDCLWKYRVFEDQKKEQHYWSSSPIYVLSIEDSVWFHRITFYETVKPAKHFSLLLFQQNFDLIMYDHYDQPEKQITIM